MIRATLLGSGGTRPLKERPLTSLYLNVEGTGVLMDCGEGTQVAFAKAGEKMFNVSVICLTHEHADHLLGLPGLLVTIDQTIRFAEPERKKNVIIVGSEGCQGFVQKIRQFVKLRNVNILYVPIIDKYTTIQFPNFEIQAFAVQHSVRCYGYNVIERTNPHLDKEKAENSGVEMNGWQFLQAGYRVYSNREQYDLSDITSGGVRYSKVSYVTDTMKCDAIVKYVKGADLAVLEGMYFTESDRAKNAKHMTFIDAAEVAREARVKRVWLTHFSPTNVSPKQGLEHATKVFKNTECGYTGLTALLQGGKYVSKK